jgi:uncharacterized BrkB/YihY/UPF0761 family membrane protein
MSENIRARLASIIVIIMIGAFAFGLIRFFGGPLYECAIGNCGKPVQPQGAAFAHEFLTWQTTIFVVWSVGLFLLWLLRNNRKSK